MIRARHVPLIWGLGVAVAWWCTGLGNGGIGITPGTSDHRAAEVSLIGAEPGVPPCLLAGRPVRPPADYAIHGRADGYHSYNARHDLQVHYRRDGFDLLLPAQEGAQRTSFTLIGIGAGGEDLLPSGTAVGRAGGGHLEMDHGSFRMVYRNTPAGMRHDVVVEERPSGNGRLKARFRIAGDMQAWQPRPDEVVFHRFDAQLMDMVPMLRYSGLKAWDADGRVLPSTMELHDDVLVLAVADTGARYPVTIDPLSSTADLELPGTQAGESFGHSVATAGDVDGDGYSDILVGSPNWNAPFINAGRVQLFLGSPTGISATPAWTHQGYQANARMGFSVSSAGDLNGDGHSDVAIGVPGLFGRGGVAVFLGSPAGLGPTPAFLLSGDSQAGSEFGWSVALAGDVNGDGYSDLLVGAPKYNNGLAAQGKAYCYHGAPATLDLGWSIAGGPVNGQLGYCVAGAGDLNGDGLSDVAIGAPFQPKVPTSNNGAVHVFRGNTGTGLGATASIVLTGVGNANFGHSVATAGDMNGDGYADLIIGAPGTSSGNGAAHLFLGSAAASLVPVAAASSLSGASAERLGSSVALGGDMNGDGYADVIIGSSNSGTDKGRVRVYKGGPAVLLNAAHLYWNRTGSVTGAYMGAAVATAGDVNGDGISDLLIGAPGQGGTGAASLFHGKADPPATAVQWSFSGSQHFGYLGRSVASAGDVNGDGYSDVLIGASGMDGQQGRAMLFLGSPTGLAAAPAWTTFGENALDQYGYAVASAGDVNGDGYSDVLIGAPSWPAYAWTGKAYLYLGGPGGLSLTPAWTHTGNVPDDRIGYALSSAGDVNGDGYSDVAIGAYMYNSGQGRAVVFHGGAGGLAGTPDWTVAGSPQSFFAASISLAGDVNGDGYDDLLIGAPLHDLAGGNNFGAAFVYHGSPAGLSSAVDWSAFGEVAGDQFGESVSMAGDVNGDGYSDVVVGAYKHTNGGQEEAGRAYVFHGSPFAGLEVAAHTVIDAGMPLPNANLGISVCSAGDVNGDGFSDVLIGAPRQAFLYPEQGRASIHLGSATGVSATEDWIGWGPAANARMGNAVALAGDVNGDGFSDVIAGASERNLGAGFEGAAYLYAGGAGGGVSMRTFQYRSDLNTPVRTGNGTFESACDWGIGQWARSALGRSKLMLAWEIMGHGPGTPSGVLFPGNSTTHSGIGSFWQDSGIPGILIKEAVSGPIGSSHPAWRARVRHHPATALDGRSYGRWFVHGLHDLQVPSLKTDLMECGPLPVTFLGASVVCENGQAQLEWATASEQNCAEFRVMRSDDGTVWRAIASVPCSGNSELVRYYRASDPSISTHAVTYYRLDQFDSNGAMTSFPVMVHVPCGGEAQWMAWPNPVADQLFVAPGSGGLPNEHVRAEVSDLSGRVVEEFIVNHTEGTVWEIQGLSRLPAGPYLIRLRSAQRGVIGHVRMIRL